MVRHILVLGASGMLGNTVVRFFSQDNHFTVKGTVRNSKSLAELPDAIRENIVSGVNANDLDSVIQVIQVEQPDIVVNCIGLVKQLSTANDPLIALPINSLFPHQLAKICSDASARFVDISTDCVFSGDKGMYNENDVPDAIDLYGLSKRFGEVDYPHAITIRTSIIGHELAHARSLIDWFLSQSISTRGFTKALFSGLPTIEIAKLIKDYVIPNSNLRGVYNVSANPISKFDLLCLVAEIYGKDIHIVEDDELVIDRSLDTSRFRDATGFVPKAWPDLIRSMYKFKLPL